MMQHWSVVALRLIPPPRNRAAGCGLAADVDGGGGGRSPAAGLLQLGDAGAVELPEQPPRLDRAPPRYGTIAIPVAPIPLNMTSRFEPSRFARSIPTVP